MRAHSTKLLAFWALQDGWAGAWEHDAALLYGCAGTDLPRLDSTCPVRVPGAVRERCGEGENLGLSGDFGNFLVVAEEGGTCEFCFSFFWKRSADIQSPGSQLIGASVCHVVYGWPRAQQPRD